MSTYSYTARTLAGQARSGTAEANDKYALAKILREQGLLLIDAERAEQRRSSLGFVRAFTKIVPIGGVSLTEKMLFARYLGVMITSGVDIPRSLGTLARQSQSKKLQEALHVIQGSVARGVSFSDSLREHPAVFSELFISMVEVGEESGNLDGVLALLADQMEKDHALRSRLRGAAIYPAIVIMVMIIVGIAMFILVVPQLAAVFREAGVKLPPSTRFLIFVGEGLKSFWFLVPVVFFGAYLAFRSFAATDFGIRTLAKFFLHAPIFSGLVRKVAAAQTARTLGALIEAGVPILRGLTITAGTLGNFYFKKSLLDIGVVVQKGTTIHEALARDTGLWPPLVVELIAVGEETGKLGEVLSKLATFYEAEVDQITRNLSTVVEPLLMVVIGVTVGFFAVSMLQPMYSLVGAIQ